MAREVERKFLVTGRDWATAAAGVRIRQGYLSLDPHRTVRIRIEGPRATIAVKGLTTGVQRAEFEYDIPPDDAAEMLASLCLTPLIEKTRYSAVVDGIRWSIDEFDGDNAGLVVAEVELASAGQAFTRPPWLGPEVSGDPRYFNSSLVSRPYRRWAEGAPTP